MITFSGDQKPMSILIRSTFPLAEEFSIMPWISRPMASIPTERETTEIITTK